MIFKKDLKKNVLIIAGTLSLAVGVIGIFLPLLPTTPLLLVAAYCYLNSSERLYNRLINSKRLGPYIKNYLEYKAVTKRAKKAALIFLWISLTISIILIKNIYIQLLLGVVGIGVSIHVISLRTME